jgi:hypothetical protein
MAIHVELCPVLQNFTRGEYRIAISEKKVQIRDLLGHLEKKFPGIKEQITDPVGSRSHYRFFLNNKHLSYNLEASIQDNDELTIIKCVAC